MKYTMSYLERLALDDGTIVSLRAIQPSDKSALNDAFSQLSKESRRRRFLTSKSALSDKELHYFTEVDGVHHYAIVAFVTTSADATPHGIGVARIVRADDDSEAAELGIVIADSWQRRGVGRRILSAIVAAAAERDIKKIRATALADNDEVRGLLKQHDNSVEIGPANRGLLQFTLTVPPPNQVDSLKSMITVLRLVALADTAEDQEAASGKKT